MNGAHRWIRLAGTTLQPSELAKPVIVLFLAYFLQTRIHAMDDWKGLSCGRLLPPLVFIALILKEPDLGTALVCAGVTALMLYLAGAQLKYFASGRRWPRRCFTTCCSTCRSGAHDAGLCQPGARSQRRGLSHPAIADRGRHGRHWGRGLMEGVQKLFYLPEPQTDFIFANICEELGLIGALLVVGLFVVLGYRGLRAAVLSTDPFARFLAFGITSAILIQAFFNMSVVLALVPTKGITLPFISSGGTSVFITLASMGVLLNITREID